MHNLSDKFSIDSIELPEYGGSPKVLLHNIFKTKKRQGLTHITGDVHYMAIRFRKNTVLTIHDVYSILQGNPLKKLYFKLLWFWIPALLVKKITVISEFSKTELCKIIPFAKHKILVIPNPVSANYKFVSYEFNQDKPRVLCVGTKSNKNLLRIFEALHDIKCELVVVGRLTEKQILALKRNDIYYSNKYNLTAIEMAETYQDCDLLCFPSTYEGFGMPIIEAQATGRPVLTSNLGAMKEVAADGACMVDPFSVTSIKTGIEKIIKNKTYRLNLIKLGLENSARYDSAVVTRQYESLYKSLI